MKRSPIAPEASDASYFAFATAKESKKRGFEEGSDSPPTKRPSVVNLANLNNLNNLNLNESETDAIEALSQLSSSPTSASNQNIAKPTFNHFLSRVSTIPLISSSLNTFTSAYEATKNASLVVKYSAETVENSTKAVLNSLEPALSSLAPLDRFACNQLDKLERSFPGVIGSTTPNPAPAPLAVINMDSMDDAQSDASQPTTASYSFAASTDGRPQSHKEGSIRSDTGSAGFYDAYGHHNHNQLITPTTKDQQHHFDFPFTRHRSSSISSTVSSTSSTSSVSTVGYESVPSYQDIVLNNNSSEMEDSFGSNNNSNQPNPSSSSSSSTAPIITRKPRGMWKSVVQGVQSNIGAMVISEDAVKALKWCLKVLQHALQNIENQVEILRRYVASYLSGLRNTVGPATNDTGPQPPPHTATNASSQNPTPPPDSTTTADLNTAVSSVTKEVVTTLKLVVDLLVKHAGSRLPPPARKRVREFILRLPSRWTSLANELNTPQNGSTTASSANSAAAQASSSGSSSSSSSSSATPPQQQQQQPTQTPASLQRDPEYPTEAQKVLTLAQESSAMLKNVMNVFSQTVLGAEAVLGRTVEEDASVVVADGLPGSLQGLKIGVPGQPSPAQVQPTQPQQPLQQQQHVQTPLSHQIYEQQQLQQQEREAEVQMDLDLD
ncbi:UNVERIFIED_CONTAM: hypothetical protein HDU68_001321 [Siphonaria sp. JEL0065]|nr:hypothetical protein HDU68_001321 [Siphonaria sp. JEL0065]